MKVSERIDQALAGNEVLTEEERNEIKNLMEGMNFDIHFGAGEEMIQEMDIKLIGIFGFLQQSNRIDEDQEEELSMILNEIEAGRYA